MVKSFYATDAVSLSLFFVSYSYCYPQQYFSSLSFSNPPYFLLFSLSTSGGWNGVCESIQGQQTLSVAPPLSKAFAQDDTEHSLSKFCHLKKIDKKFSIIATEVDCLKINFMKISLSNKFHMKIFPSIKNDESGI